MKPKIKAILFDLDGTLIDSLADIALALNNTFKLVNLTQVDTNTINALIGNGAKQLLIDCLKYLPISELSVKWQQPKQLTKLYQLFIQQYALINGQQAKVYPNATSGLAQLSNKLPLACITNKPVKLAQQLLQTTNLKQYFQLIYGGDSFTHKKPHPLPLLIACDKLNVAPENTLMVGDSINDVTAAKAAKCLCAILPYGYNGGQDIKLMGADLIIDDISQLTNLV